ncbi:hypothetical protein SR1949_49180 [Sphaerospermopsis reniformis]|uniref:Uncharacterized protein n=1 Tax=Sphaerospermopsis reniformis TaxID=531300 RepID=A0A480A959_9CYAN|nr:hypothetical protein [Sphaerospermopsis reniformis]GCL39788.1 hypothetical protein SR1949_49180 [Sphaerospermopsis reniformis]
MDSQEEPTINYSNLENSDATFVQQVQRLHQLTVYGRWLFVCCLWVIIAPVCLWNLRTEFTLWQQYFTWVAVRYALAFHPFATVGLAFCIGMTVSVLIWQIRNILIGLPQPEKQRLEQQVFKIRQQGPSHPLWKLVIGN